MQWLYVLRNVHTVWLYYRLWVFGHNGGGRDDAVCRVLSRLVRWYTNHYLYHNITPATLLLLLSHAVATVASHHHLRAQCFYAILPYTCLSRFLTAFVSTKYYGHFYMMMLNNVVCTCSLTNLMYFSVTYHCITSAGVVTGYRYFLVPLCHSNKSDCYVTSLYTQWKQ